MCAVAAFRVWTGCCGSTLVRTQAQSSVHLIGRILQLTDKKKKEKKKEKNDGCHVKRGRPIFSVKRLKRRRQGERQGLPLKVREKGLTSHSHLHYVNSSMFMNKHEVAWEYQRSGAPSLVMHRLLQLLD